MWGGLVRGDPRELCAPLPHEDTARMWSSVSQEAALTGPQGCWCFDLRRPPRPPRTVRIPCLLLVSLPVCAIFVLSAPIDKDCMPGVSNAKNHKI